MQVQATNGEANAETNQKARVYTRSMFVRTVKAKVFKAVPRVPKQDSETKAVYGAVRAYVIYR